MGLFFAIIAAMGGGGGSTPPAGVVLNPDLLDLLGQGNSRVVGHPDPSTSFLAQLADDPVFANSNIPNKARNGKTNTQMILTTGDEIDEIDTVIDPDRQSGLFMLENHNDVYYRSGTTQEYWDRFMLVYEEEWSRGYDFILVATDFQGLRTPNGYVMPSGHTLLECDTIKKAINTLILTNGDINPLDIVRFDNIPELYDETNLAISVDKEHLTPLGNSYPYAALKTHLLGYTIRPNTAKVRVRQASVRELNEVYLRMSRPCTGTTAGYTVTINSVVATLVSISDGRNRALAISETIAYGDVVEISYNSSTGDTVDSDGNTMLSFTDTLCFNVLPDPAKLLTWRYIATELEELHNGLNRSGTGYTGGGWASSVETVDVGDIIQFRSTGSAADGKIIILTDDNPPVDASDGIGWNWQNALNVLFQIDGSTSNGEWVRAGGVHWYQLKVLADTLELYSSVDGVTFYLADTIPQIYITNPADLVFPKHVAFEFASHNSAFQDIQKL